jgi:hypothetical protein
VSGIGDIEEGAGHFRETPGTFYQRMLPDSSIPMLYGGCAIELTEAAAYVKSIHTGATEHAMLWIGWPCSVPGQN